MASSVEVVAAPKVENAKPKVRLGVPAFRPNAIIKASAYKSIIIAELILLCGLWLLMPKIIPSPMQVIAALQELVTDQGLIGELWTSLTLNVEAIALSTVISLIISYSAVIPVVRPIAAAIGKGRFLSLVGLSFVMTLLVGGGHPLKLGLLTFNMTVFFVTSMVDVVLQVPEENLDYVRTLRCGEWRVLLESRVFGTLGSAFDMMRQNAAIGWMMLTMVEGMVRGEGGIGRLLSDQEKHFSLAAIFAVQAVFVLVGIGQDLLIGWLKTVFAPWSTLSYKRK
jgi:NitT/TauT family transport system permease protein